MESRLHPVMVSTIAACVMSCTRFPTLWAYPADEGSPADPAPVGTASEAPPSPPPPPSGVSFAAPEIVVPDDASYLILDNRMLDHRIILSCPDHKPTCPVTLRSRPAVPAKTISGGGSTPGKARISAIEILTAVKPGSRTTMVIGSGRTARTLRIERRALIPDSFKDLAPVYRQMADDARTKGHVIASVAVVLWDGSFTGEGLLRGGKRAWWAYGEDPDNNLNWGGGTGIRTLLLKQPGWKLRYEEKNARSPFRRAVFSRTVQPDRFWKTLGVDRPFDAHVALLAFGYREIRQGYAYFGALTQGSSDAGKIPLPGGPELDLSRSRIVGIAVHYIPEGPLEVGARLAPKSPKAVFMASCFSARVFGPLLLRENLVPVFLSIPTTSSEGYIYIPILEGLLRGAGPREILAAVDASYYKWHQRHTGETQYTNPASKGFEKMLADQDGDWDADGLRNDLDPEPTHPNEIEPVAGATRIVLSGGRVMEIGTRQ